MQIKSGMSSCIGFSRLYNYGLKNYPNYMITKKAEERLKILIFWKKYGIEATFEAFGTKKSILYIWWNKYKASGYKLENLNPASNLFRIKNRKNN